MSALSFLSSNFFLVASFSGFSTCGAFSINFLGSFPLNISSA